jgi:hypothetical protein
MRTQSPVSRIALALLLVAACGSTGQDNDGTGGSGSNSGGSTGSSGGATSATGGKGGGGTTGTGGQASGGSGGSGGAVGSGGASSTGGSGSGGSGGAAGTGGQVGTGGTTSGGGAVGTGGSAGAGGTTAKGGASGSGGSVGTGGVTAKGGASGTGGAVGTGGTTTTSTAAKFSFFVVSYAALQKIANSTKGLGGDLRYGLTGAGAGLKGADKICATVAESSMAGAGAKTWHAFLSATADENGKQVNAIDRIGAGPWYDRLGRLFANNLSELYYDRPKSADAAIKNDFPNENGVTNQNPDKTGNVDNHDMLTGSNTQGKLYGSTATCSDWTSTATSGSKPRVGHSWPTSANQCSTTSTAGGTGAGGSSGGSMGGGGMGSMCNWMSALDESGCAPGVNLIQNGGPGNDGTVGSGGGYGGFYCFALTP